MASSPSDADQDWRLEVRVENPKESPLERVLEATGRGGGAAAADARAAVGDDVAVTHDGARTFAYANSEAAVKGARDAIDAALRADGIKAEDRVAHWEDDEWTQVDPPLTVAAAEQRRRAHDAAEQVETQTFVARAGFAAEGGLEQAMTRWAEHLGIECQVVEHRHLLSSQLAFTVRGPRYQLEEFRRALIEEGWVTFRADGFGTGLM